MNTNYNFNSMFNLENETTPETACEKQEMSTFDKVVVTAAKVGVISAATILTVAAVNTVVGEVTVGVKAGKAGFAAAKNHFAEKKAGKASKKAAEMAAFKNSLIEQGFSEEDATEMTKAEFGLEG